MNLKNEWPQHKNIETLDIQNIVRQIKVVPVSARPVFVSLCGGNSTNTKFMYSSNAPPIRPTTSCSQYNSHWLQAKPMHSSYTGGLLNSTCWNINTTLALKFQWEKCFHSRTNFSCMSAGVLRRKLLSKKRHYFVITLPCHYFTILIAGDYCLLPTLNTLKMQTYILKHSIFQVHVFLQEL